MNALAWVVAIVSSITLGYIIGYNFRDLKDQAKKVVEKVKDIPSQPVEEIKSQLYDPDDPAQRIKWEHEEQMRKLNPDKFFGDRK